MRCAFPAFVSRILVISTTRNILPLPGFNARAQHLCAADDVDFVHHDPNRLEYILLFAERVFRTWSLTINMSKTERTNLAGAPDTTNES